MKILSIFLSILLLASCADSSKSDSGEATDDGKFDSVNIKKEAEVKIAPNYHLYSKNTKHDTILSGDSLPIWVDIYLQNDQAPTILLCHQAGFSRGEYLLTGPMLADSGYSSIAIDQRSGKEANGITNETAYTAEERGLPIAYWDAKQDIEAAINHLFQTNGNKKIILVGSSYSATLVLMIGKNNDKVKAVASFSPGEYLKGITVSDSISGYSKPIYVTSSRSEIPIVVDLVKNIDPSFISHFQPEVEGIHGSRGLWENTEGHLGYWNSFLQFLGDNTEIIE